jgi:glycerophosphoryl diester phosphodiesterase
MLLRQAAQAQRSVIVWTVDTIKAMRRYVAMDVHSIITDRPTCCGPSWTT